MDFKSRYVQELRDKDPALFRELVRSHQIDQFLQQKSAEAHALLEQLLAPEPKGPDGLPKDPQALRLAEERVFAQMTEFEVPENRQNPEPPDDLPTPTSRAPTTKFSLVK